MSRSPPHDTVGAFCVENNATLDGAAAGPLAGLAFAAKDCFDIEGVRTGFGQPDWLRTHAPARATAVAVTRVLGAGADLVGKVHCDELCYSLTGENVHYGTPDNISAPGRVPGGSSNGSAAAVAAGLVDFALGTDCGGSIRIPASYCGLYGLRPTWGRVPTDGVVPFGPSFDVVGWLARDAGILMRVGRVLLDEARTPRAPRRLLVARDAFDRVDAGVGAALQRPLDAVAALGGERRDIVVSHEGLDVWFEAFRTIQAAEVWASLGDWVTRTRPRLGPGVKERLEYAATVTPDMLGRANDVRGKVRERMSEILEPGDVLCLPTSPRVAPLKGLPTDKIEIEFRTQAMCLLCISGLSGLPQISMPLARVEGLPLGLSLIASAGCDIDLLHVAQLMGQSAT